MPKENFTAWILENGVIGIPKNLIGFMEPLGLNFEDLGKITYLLYCGCNNIKENDSYAINAVKTLQRKKLIKWFPENERVDFSPMYNLIASKIGGKDVQILKEEKNSSGESTYSDILKKIERELGRFLSTKEKIEIQKVTQRYNWSYDLVCEMFLFYQKSYRRLYVFSFFAQMAFGAKVEDKESLKRFIDNLNFTFYKVIEIKRLLGHKNNPTEIEKECYLKWINQWKFSHEMVLLAVQQTIYAIDPSFKYLDSILVNWYAQKIKTPEDVQKYLKYRKQKKSQKTSKGVYNKHRQLNDLME